MSANWLKNQTGLELVTHRQSPPTSILVYLTGHVLRAAGVVVFAYFTVCTLTNTNHRLTGVMEKLRGNWAFGAGSAEN